MFRLAQVLSLYTCTQINARSVQKKFERLSLHNNIQRAHTVLKTRGPHERFYGRQVGLAECITNAVVSACGSGFCKNLSFVLNNAWGVERTKKTFNFKKNCNQKLKMVLNKMAVSKLVDMDSPFCFNLGTSKIWSSVFIDYFHRVEVKLYLWWKGGFRWLTTRLKHVSPQSFHHPTAGWSLLCRILGVANLSRFQKSAETPRKFSCTDPGAFLSLVASTLRASLKLTRCDQCELILWCTKNVMSK